MIGVPLSKNVSKKILEDILDYLSNKHPGFCRKWFNEIKAISLDSGLLTLLAPNSVHVAYLQKMCVDLFVEAAQNCTGKLLSVRFVGSLNEPKEHYFYKKEVNLFDEQMLLSPDNTFENFIIGPDNQFAHAASIAVSDNPGVAYNPLFIHGGVGLGKTHLLQAICHKILNKTPESKVFYTSCNGFMTCFMDAVQNGKMVDFRNRFRNFDVLVVDDIHDLAHRDRTQEEFFHTFNSLFQAKKQVILSSDAAPTEIPHLEQRLISRFSCGLVTRVDKPGFETRIEIVKKKALLKTVAVPEDVVNFIASKIDSNVRELEGAITSLQGMHILNKKKSEINMDLAKKALEHFGFSKLKENHLNIQLVLEHISKYYDLKISDILSKKRNQSITRPRQIGMWLSRKLTRHSLEEIGGYFGGRDHTTVIHAIKLIEKIRETDKNVKKEIIELENEIMLSTNISTNL